MSSDLIFSDGSATARYHSDSKVVSIKTPKSKVKHNCEDAAYAANYVADVLKCDVKDVRKAFGVVPEVKSDYRTPEENDAANVELKPGHVGHTLEGVRLDKAMAESKADAASEAISAISFSEIVHETADRLPGVPSIDIHDGDDVAKLSVDLGVLTLDLVMSYDEKARGVYDDVLHVEVVAELDLPIVAPVQVLDVSETLPVGEWLQRVDKFQLLA